MDVFDLPIDRSGGSSISVLNVNRRRAGVLVTAISLEGDAIECDVMSKCVMMALVSVVVIHAVMAAVAGKSQKQFKIVLLFVLIDSRLHSVTIKPSSLLLCYRIKFEIFNQFLAEMQRIAFRLLLSSCVCVCVSVCLSMCVCMPRCGSQENGLT